MTRIASIKFSVLFVMLLSVIVFACLGGASCAGSGRTGIPPPEFECPDPSAGTTHPYGLSDDAFLDLIQERTFAYFWCQANPDNGLVRDRSTPGSPANIAATGYGLSACTVGIDRGWVSREAGSERVWRTLRFFADSAQGPVADATGYHGFYYRFLDLETGRRAWHSELSSVDSALLLAGVLHAQMYFDRDNAQEREIRRLARFLYERADWPWLQARGAGIALGWMPETGFIPCDWQGYNEAMIVYVLALGSPTHPVGPDAWTAWTKGYDWSDGEFPRVMFPSLYGHQYSQIWIDFRGLQDAYMRGKGSDYARNSLHATLAQIAYARENAHKWRDYGNLWGITASDSPAGYSARGIKAEGYDDFAFAPDDGTIVPSAAAGSIVFTPEESLYELRYMYETYAELWGPYGFRDAFNPTKNWFADGNIGIDQGPILLMIENWRSGRIWQAAMENPAIKRGLKRAGFMPAAAQQAKAR